MLSRRGFFIGAGGLLTAAFMMDARAFIRRNDAPLLAAPLRTAHTLYWEWPDGLDEPQLFLDEEPLAARKLHSCGANDVRPISHFK
jgi:hypothetical protein